MLSDERLHKIEQLISDSLNEDAAVQKVSSRYLPAASALTSLRKGGLGAANARVYAVKVSQNLHLIRAVLTITIF